MTDYENLTAAQLRGMATNWTGWSGVPAKTAFLNWLDSLGLTPGGEEEQIIIQHPK